MNRVTTVGAATLALSSALAGGSMLVAPVAQAEPVVPAGSVAQVGEVVSGRSAAAKGLPQTGDQLSYVQHGEWVRVYRSGDLLAQVTARSAAHPGGRGRLVLTVQARKAFAFRAGQFVWADSAAHDHEAFNPLRRIRVPAGITDTVSIRFDGVRDGNVLWAPRRENTIGVWKARGRRLTGAPQLLSPSYVQRDAVVSVYKAGGVAGRVTAQSAVHRGGKGKLTLDIQAYKKLVVVPSNIVWADPDGTQHKATNARYVTVPAKTTKTITVNYRDVGAGGVTWSPRANLVAGAWAVG